jgi:hypothetical protein
MSATDRQNRLLVTEDWKKIYQSFRNADFQSYDFENLRRVMVDYIRQNYPEDFNDYIESSEYLALLDVIAFLGQSVAFRVDLNARENFLELAERRESVLRLSRLISYNAKRTTAASGLMKVTSVQTSENILDGNGRNLSGQVVSWNDSSNDSWYDQFIKIMNAAMQPTQQFGNPSDKATIYGIPTERYRLSSNSTGVPVYSFTKTVAGKMMTFEVTSTTFSGKDFIYEETPKDNNQLSCIFRNDGRGYGSAGSGFFLNFTQGTLASSQFTVDQPRSNEIIDVGTTNINETDVWLYQLDKNGAELDENLWTKVPSVEGNNIIYNSVNKSIKNIFSVITRANDAVSLSFSDGTFGNKPLGTFKVYYRTSNGVSYTIHPRDIRNVSLSVPYLSNTGKSETLTLNMSLASSVSNAESTESNASIKANAPATFYTQNRMITGEDYNICPLSASQQVLKVKAINRASSGISRYFDLVDPTGKFSSTNLFATDGVIYKDVFKSSVKFSYTNKTDIQGIIYNTLSTILKKAGIRNFYYMNYAYATNLSWNELWSTAGDTSTVNVAADKLAYMTVGTLIKISIDGINTLWATIVKVVGNQITSSVALPAGSVIIQVIPRWRTSLESSVITTMIDLIFENKSFGLSYDAATQSWIIVYESNLNLTSTFDLNSQKNNTNKHLDSSWMISFTTDNEYYTIENRELRYIFESDKEIRFYFDSSETVYNSVSSSVVQDKINILNINTLPYDNFASFKNDLKWDIVSEYNGLDGYIDNKKIVITFADSDNNGVVDDPELFEQVVSPDTYVVQERYLISQGQEDYRYVDNNNAIVLICNNVFEISPVPGKYYYVKDAGIVLKCSDASVLEPSLDYKVYNGRDKIKFQYTHNASYNSRIDPSASNFIDVYVLTKGYDIEMRQWINGSISTKPLPPGSDELYNTIAPSLNLIKSISDEVVYHPVSYKILFGSSAAPEVQATFKITKTPGQVISDNDIKSKVIVAINTFFALDNWDFGDTFYFTELSAYVCTQASPYISNFVIVPKHSELNFGGLFEIKAVSNQILLSSATVTDIEVVSGLTSSNIKSSNVIANNNTSNTQLITSSSYGSI